MTLIAILTLQQVFIDDKYVGDYDAMFQLNEDGNLDKLLNMKKQTLLSEAEHRQRMVKWTLITPFITTRPCRQHEHSFSLCFQYVQNLFCVLCVCLSCNLNPLLLNLNS